MDLKESLFANLWSTSTSFFPKECWHTNSKEIDVHNHGEKNHRFYAFELMIHLLVE